MESRSCVDCYKQGCKDNLQGASGCSNWESAVAGLRADNKMLMERNKLLLEAYKAAKEVVDTSYGDSRFSHNLARIRLDAAKHELEEVLQGGCV